ncbi:amino acid ABC transporter substrate-binding protein, PAAT family [Micromonospora pallida]|uniref:Amino acid ABC transporter substrate-binding protein, PAAT family n=1 Tax=Micromonospora pallida TaxID=145854 RepID=A0A1C6S0C2_9ACTN|nr:transporter substrate-binding domain-containing protein [Micromonospora pallida]SCL22855.1 amino acid ABC transporter substrate-binding protein, PAAT family [Micromonospora pallida]
MRSYPLTAPALRRLAAGFAAAALIGLTACTPGAAEPAAGTSESPSGVTDLSAQAQLKPTFTADETLRALLPERLRSSGVVRTATSVGLPPINFPGGSSTEVKGLNADLVAAVEQLLGVRFQSENYPSTAAQLLALDSKRIDLTTSTNGDTKARQEKYDFVDILLSRNVLMVKVGNPAGLTSAADVCGRRFGEVKGSFSVLPTLRDVCQKAGRPEPEVSSFEDIPSMQLALASGRIDTYVGSDFNVVWDKSQGKAVDSVALPEAGTLVLGWTVRKGDEGLRDAVLGALRKLHEDGYYAEAFDRWGLSSNRLDPGVNIGAQGTGFNG